MLTSVTPLILRLAPWQFALIVASGIPASLAVIGTLVEWICNGIDRILASFIGAKNALRFHNYLTFPGVILHEFSHAIMTILTGAQLTEMALFKPQRDSLGHICFRTRGNYIFRSLQYSLISSAPVYLGILYIMLCHQIRIRYELSLPLQALLFYLSVSIFFHLKMSRSDLKNYAKGLPVLMPLLAIIGFLIYVLLHYMR